MSNYSAIRLPKVGLFPSTALGYHPVRLGSLPILRKRAHRANGVGRKSSKSRPGSVHQRRTRWNYRAPNRFVRSCKRNDCPVRLIAVMPDGSRYLWAEIEGYPANVDNALHVWRARDGIESSRKSSQIRITTDANPSDTRRRWPQCDRLDRTSRILTGSAYAVLVRQRSSSET